MVLWWPPKWKPNATVPALLSHLHSFYNPQPFHVLAYKLLRGFLSFSLFFYLFIYFGFVLACFAFVVVVVFFVLLGFFGGCCILWSYFIIVLSMHVVSERLIKEGWVQKTFNLHKLSWCKCSIYPCLDRFLTGFFGNCLDLQSYSSSGCWWNLNKIKMGTRLKLEN